MLVLHKKGHEKPKGLINYKCVFCPWYAKKKQAILEHMAVHTERPMDFMSEVEKNLITPFAAESDIGVGGVSVEKEKNGVPMGDVSDVMSDFSAILSAAGEDLNLNDVKIPLREIGEENPPLGNEASDSEPEIEDEEAYIHAGEDALDHGLEFVRQAPREIQKVIFSLQTSARFLSWCT